MESKWIMLLFAGLFAVSVMGMPATVLADDWGKDDGWFNGEDEWDNGWGDTGWGEEEYGEDDWWDDDYGDDWYDWDSDYYTEDWYNEDEGWFNDWW